MASRERPGLYIHVPFCERKCPYCDFYSVPLAGSRAGIGGYLESVACEWRQAASGWPAFDTLYIGGGTPSVLDPEQIASLLDTARASLAQPAEITVELNPADVRAALLAALRAAGVNRLSLGVQSFADDELAWLGRRHDSAAAVRAIALIREADFGSLGLDLIYALPGQDPSRWRRNLQRAVALAPEHLSCYALTVAPGTPLWRRAARGEIVTDEDASAALFLDGSRLLCDAGYEHYEVSNFARLAGDPGASLRSRHNQKYWSRTPTLGLGPAAHSFDGERRWWNARDLDGYAAALAERGDARAGEERIDAAMARLEAIALGVRTADGVALAVVGDEQRCNVDRICDAGWATRREGALCPTREGLLRADGIARLLGSDPDT
ncbi:MAG: radical SAM family heme chaperone HemW [Deltaproteobacteria bacterium]|nr:radical SAM family heme chaperone HemW [Deltaproteobacteria bacterium]